MSTQHMFFVEKEEKYFPNTYFYLDLCFYGSNTVLTSYIDDIVK